MHCWPGHDRFPPDRYRARYIVTLHGAKLAGTVLRSFREIRTAKVFPEKAFLGRLCKGPSEWNYGEGDGFTFTFVSVLVSVFLSGGGDSLLITVVLLSLFSAGGVTVVDFS